MRKLFEEYGDLALTMVSGTVAISLFLLFLSFSITRGYDSFDYREGIVTFNSHHADKIALFEADDLSFKKGETADRDLFRAQNDLGEDISMFVRADKLLDTGRLGETEITYTLMYNGEYEVRTARYFVYEDELIAMTTMEGGADSENDV